MLQKISNLSLRAYLGVTGFVKCLKNDERGLSGIVVTVLLILVAVLAVVIFWSTLKNWLVELWETLKGEAKSGLVK